MAYAMGIQNALVTRVSGAVVRTTHMTGVVTDIGIQLVKMMTWVRDGARGHGLGGLVWMIRRLPTAEQFARTRLHLGLATSFIVRVHRRGRCSSSTSGPGRHGHALRGAGAAGGARREPGRGVRADDAGCLSLLSAAP